MNCYFFSFGGKLEHKNANTLHWTHCACFTCGKLLHRYSANPCSIFVSHWCEAALRSENILTIRPVFCLADSQLFVAPLPLPASPVPACYLFSYPRSSDQSRCKSPPYSIPCCQTDLSLPNPVELSPKLNAATFEFWPNTTNYTF